MCKCWKGYIHVVELAQRQKHELERKNYQQADLYYQYHLCESAIRLWNQRATFVHTILFNTVQRMRICCQHQRVLELWKSKTVFQKIRFARLNKEAQELGRKSILRLVVNRWNESVIMIRRQQIEEERVEEKWRKVKEWISDL